MRECARAARRRGPRAPLRGIQNGTPPHPVASLASLAPCRALLCAPRGARRRRAMVKLTLIARVADGLPLAEGLETEKNADLDAYKQQAKARSAQHRLYSGRLTHAHRRSSSGWRLAATRHRV